MIIPSRLHFILPHIHQIILGGGYGAQKTALLICLRVDIQSLTDCLHHGFLIIRIINGKCGIIAKAVNVSAQDPHAGRVKGTHPNLIRAEPHQLIHALPHLARRLIGERDRENIPRIHAHLVDQIRDAMRQGTRFAGSGTGQQQQRPLCAADCLFLFRI